MTDFYWTQRLAEEKGVSRNAIYQAIFKGTLKPYDVKNGEYIFSVEEAQKYLKSKRGRPLNRENGHATIHNKRTGDG